MRCGVGIAAAALVVGLATGCTETVSGGVVRSAYTAAERSLPSDGELSDLLRTPMRQGSSPISGTLDALRDEWDTGSPSQCAGVPHAGLRAVFEDAPIVAAARGFWSRARPDDDMVSVVVAIIEFDSQDSARARGDRMAAQWLDCRGDTVTDRIGDIPIAQTIVDAAGSESIWSAQVNVVSTDGTLTPFWSWRALARNSSYLVDVEVVGRPTEADDSTAIARLIAGKLS